MNYVKGWFDCKVLNKQIADRLSSICIQEFLKKEKKIYFLSMMVFCMQLFTLR